MENKILKWTKSYLPLIITFFSLMSVVVKTETSSRQIKKKELF